MTPFSYPCDGPCVPAGPRPYARKKIPSVTTLLSVMSKDGLQWGASKEAALFAVHHQREWRDLDPDAAVDRIRRHFKGVWDASARVGSLCHEVAEAWSHGRVWEAPADLEDEVVARMGGYVDGLAAFFADNNPEVVATELVVAGNCGFHGEAEFPYTGTADWLCNINGEPWLLDIKTTSNLDESKEFYTREWRLQLAAYRWASDIVHYHGTEEAARMKFEDCVPRPTRTGIVHMRGNGSYQLIEVATPVELLNELAACAIIHRWGLTAGHKTPAPVIVAEHRPEPVVYAPRPEAPVNVDAMLG